MKSKILCAIFLTLCLACEKDDVYEKVDEVPTDIFNAPLCQTLLSSVNQLFPESKDNQSKYANIFNGSVQQRLVLSKETDVYVSFVAEGASLGSVLGYYIYNQSGTPGSPDDINKEIVFPHLSNTVLNPGDTRKLGNAKLPAGTVIGFFLIPGGFRDNAVYFKRPTIYTDSQWNNGQTTQHVLFQEEKCGSIVVGFEDKPTTNSDGDFNDIIFTISDNISNEPNVSFDLQNIAKLTN